MNKPDLQDEMDLVIEETKLDLIREIEADFKVTNELLAAANDLLAGEHYAASGILLARAIKASEDANSALHLKGVSALGKVNELYLKLKKEDPKDESQNPSGDAGSPPEGQA